MKRFIPLATAILLAVAISAVVIISMSRDRPPAPLAVRTEYALGTQCSISLHANRLAPRSLGPFRIVRYAAPRGADPEEALTAAFLRIREIDARMSANRPESEVSAVSALSGRGSVHLSPDTLLVLDTALSFAAKTGGVFDPTIGPLVKLWGIGTESARLPSPVQIAEARTLVDWKDVLLDRQASTASLRRRGMSLDLGAVAKGYAADEAARILADHGFRRGIIDLGGNILAIGQRSTEGGWRIGIQSPAEARGAYMAIVEAEDASVVTSGAYERYFEEKGQRFHHILDPRTGYPSDSGLVSATILSPSSILADCLSTSVFALGREAGMRLVETEGLDCFLVDAGRKVWTTPGLEGRFSLLPGEFSLAD